MTFFQNPVTNVTDLPATDPNGSLRLVTSRGQLYRFDVQWQPIHKIGQTFNQTTQTELGNLAPHINAGKWIKFLHPLDWVFITIKKSLNFPNKALGGSLARSHGLQIFLWDREPNLDRIGAKLSRQINPAENNRFRLKISPTRRYLSVSAKLFNYFPKRYDTCYLRFDDSNQELTLVESGVNH